MSNLSNLATAYSYIKKDELYKWDVDSSGNWIEVSGIKKFFRRVCHFFGCKYTDIFEKAVTLSVKNMTEDEKKSFYEQYQNNSAGDALVAIQLFCQLEGQQTQTNHDQVNDVQRFLEEIKKRVKQESLFRQRNADIEQIKQIISNIVRKKIESIYVSFQWHKYNSPCIDNFGTICEKLKAHYDKKKFSNFNWNITYQEDSCKSLADIKTGEPQKMSAIFTCWDPKDKKCFISISQKVNFTAKEDQPLMPQAVSSYFLQQNATIHSGSSIYQPDRPWNPVSPFGTIQSAPELKGKRLFNFEYLPPEVTLENPSADLVANLKAALEAIKEK